MSTVPVSRSELRSANPGFRKRSRDDHHHLVSTRICDDPALHCELFTDALMTNLTTFNAPGSSANPTASLEAMERPVIARADVTWLDVTCYVNESTEHWIAPLYYLLRRKMRNLYFSRHPDWSSATGPWIFHDDMPHGAVQFKLLFEWTHDYLAPYVSALPRSCGLHRRAALQYMQILARYHRKQMSRISAMIVHMSPDRVGTPQLILLLRRAMF